MKKQLLILAACIAIGTISTTVSNAYQISPNAASSFKVLSDAELTQLVYNLPIVKSFEQEIKKKSGGKHQLSIRHELTDRVKGIYQTTVGEGFSTPQNAMQSKVKYTFLIDAKTRKVLNPDGAPMK
jgi:predicted small secreted protein